MPADHAPRRALALTLALAFALALALALALSGLACSRRLPYELASPAGWPAGADSFRIVQGLAADLDGNGIEELALEAPGGVRVLAWNGQGAAPAWTAPWPEGYGARPGSVQLGAAADLDGDGTAEIVLAAMRDDAREWGIWSCSARERRPRRIASLPEGQDDRPDGVWDGIWVIGGVLPRAAREAPALIVYSRTGFDGSGRCVLALDAATGQELWRFACGPNPERLAIADLEGDGEPEVVFTGNAQDNLEGAAVNGTSDDVAMLFALDARGARRWSRVLGGVFFNTHLQVADLDGDGAVEIVTATDNHGADQDDHLCVWSGAGEPRAQRTLPAGARGLLLVPARGPEPGLVCVGGQDGVLRRLAFTGAALADRGTSSRPSPLEPLLAADLTDRPGLELVTRGADGVLELLDARLRVLARARDTRPRAPGNALRPQYPDGPAAWVPARGVTVVLSGDAAWAARSRATARGEVEAPPLVTRDLAGHGGRDPLRPTTFEVVAAPGDTLRALRFLPADLDGDGREELVADAPAGIGAWTWRDGLPALLWVWEAPPRFRRPWPGIFLDGAWDVTGDGVVEIVTTAVSGDEQEWRLWVLDPRSQKLLADIALPVGPDRRADGRWDGGWLAAGVLPADRAAGAPAAVVLRCRCGFDWDLRQIRAVALDGRERWVLPLGPNPSDVHVTDLEGDGRREIVVGADSPGNLGPAKLAGRSDDHSLLLVLGEDGRVLWERTLGPESVPPYARVGDLDGGGRAEIVTATDSRVPDVDDRLCVWSAGGELLAERILPEHPRQMAIDPAADGHPGSIYVGGRQAAVRRYVWRRGALHEVHRAERPVGFRVYEAHDVHSSPGPELIVSTSEDRFWLLAADLRPLARTGLSTNAYPARTPKQLPPRRTWPWRPAPGTSLLMLEDAGMGLVIESGRR